MAENTIDLGINIAELEADKVKALSILEDLFAELKVYQANGVVPINLTGLTELNASSRATEESLSILNANLNQLNTLLTTQSSRAKISASSTTELGLAVDAYKKQLDDAAKLSAKLSAADSEQAKNTAALKLELQQVNKALLDEAKALNTSVQAKIAEKKASQEQIAQEQINIKLRQEAAAEIAAFNKSELASFNQKVQAEKEIAKQQVLEEQQNVELRKQAAAEIEAFNSANFSEYKAQVEQENAVERQRQIEIEKTNAAEQQRIKTAQQDARVTAQLSDEYAVLNKYIKDQETLYANLVLNGQRNTQQAQGVRENVLNSRKLLGGVDEDLESGRGGLAGLGKELTGSLSLLRNIAYILPGIGIAGIFNLAFQAGSQLLNEILDISTNMRELDRVTEIYGKDGVDTIKKVDYEMNSFIATINKSVSLTKELGELNFGKNIVTDVGSATTDIVGMLDKLQEYPAKIDAIQKSTNKLFLEFQSSLQPSDVETLALSNNDIDVALPKLNEDAQKIYGVYKNSLDEQFKLQKEQNDLFEGLDTQRLALRIQEEQVANTERLNLEKSTTEQIISEIVSRYKRIASASISGEATILSAQAKLYQEERAQNQLQFDLVNNNINSTPNDKKVAGIDLQTANNAAYQKYLETTQKIRDDFDQRRITAVTQTNNSIQTQIAKNNEDISKNENISLDARLLALQKNINARSQIIQNEYDKEIALSKIVYKTPEEKKVFEQTRKTGVSDIQSDAIQKVKELTESYGANLFNDIKLDNSSISERQDEISRYTQTLTRLNTALLNGQVSLKNYTEAKKGLDYAFTINQDTHNIADDLDRLDSYKDKLKNDLEPQIKKASADLAVATESGNAQAIEQATARYNVLIDLQKKFQGEIKDLNNQEAEDEKKRAEDLIQIQADADKTIGDNKIAIWANIEKTIDELIEGYYQKDEERIQRNIELQDKYYDNEKNAIQASTLSQKDKIATEIQLTAQKQAADEAAAKAIRKDKHDEAVIEKAVAEVEIVANTAKAVTAALASPTLNLIPGAAEAVASSYAILGATQLALVAAKPVPAYAKGTEGTPRDEFALIGEAGVERVKEPNKPFYFVDKPTISFLPKGTEVTPLKSIPQIKDDKVQKNDEWQLAARYIVKNLKGDKKPIHNNINIDLSFEMYKHKRIYE